MKRLTQRRRVHQGHKGNSSFRITKQSCLLRQLIMSPKTALKFGILTIFSLGAIKLEVENKSFLLCDLGELRVKILEIIMLLIGDLFYGNFVAKRTSSKTANLRFGLVLEEALEKPAFRLVFPVNLRLLFQKLKFWKSLNQQLSLTPRGEEFSIFSPCFDSKIQRFSFS